MNATVKELKNGKWALIGDRELVLSAAASNITDVSTDNHLSKHDFDSRMQQLEIMVVKLTKLVSDQRLLEVKPPTLSISKLTLAPMDCVDDLRKQIKKEVLELGRSQGEGKFYDWSRAYKIYYMERDYDVYELGEKYLKGKGTTLLNRFESDGRLKDLLLTLRAYLHRK